MCLLGEAASWYHMGWRHTLSTTRKQQFVRHEFQPLV